MLYDYMKQGFLTAGDWNCAERMLRGANEVYGLGLDDNAMKVAAGFGGGMASGSVCGVLTGAIMALGVLFVKERAHESERIRTLTQELMLRFHKEIGKLDCEHLKPRYQKPDEGCVELLLVGARLLDDIVARERA